MTFPYSMFSNMRNKVVVQNDNQIEYSENWCEGTYDGPEFINGSDVAHQFSNKMTERVEDKLRELYNKGELSKVLMDGQALDISELKTTPEGLQEYWIQWKNKIKQSSCKWKQLLVIFKSSNKGYK